MLEYEQLSLSASLLSAFFVGLSFGSGPCNLSCLPYLGPVLLGPAASKPVTAVLLPFMGGRLSGYTLLGVAAAALGSVVQLAISGLTVPLVATVATLWLAWRMWFQVSPGVCASATTGVQVAASGVELIASDTAPAPAQSRLQLWVLGFTLALNPCIPLLALLAAAAQSADPFRGGILALSFGLGAVVIPSLLIRYGVALLGKELRAQLSGWQSGLSRAGALMLLLVAVNTAWRGFYG